MRNALCLLITISLTAILPPIAVELDQSSSAWPATPEGATTYHVDHGETPAVLLARANLAASTLLVGTDAHARSTMVPAELVSRRGFDPATSTAAAIIAAIESQNGLAWLDPIVARNRSFNVGNELTKLITAGYTVGHAAAQDPDELQELLDQYAASLGTQIDAMRLERDEAVAARDQAIADRDAAQEALTLAEAAHTQELADQLAAFEQQRAADIEAVRQFLIMLADRLATNQ